MHSVDICKNYKDLVGHGNFPETIDEFIILLDLLKPNSRYDVLVSGVGLVLDDNQNLVITDDCDIAKLLNKLGGSSRNSDFLPKSDLSKRFLDLVLKDNYVINNLLNLSLSDFYSEQDIDEYNKSQDDWKYYHEKATYKNGENMDLLTRAGHEKL